jgi:hypothetical protein
MYTLLDIHLHYNYILLAYFPGVARVFIYPNLIVICVPSLADDFYAPCRYIIHSSADLHTFFFIDTFVSLAIPSLQLRLTTSLFSNLDSKLKTNSQCLSIDQCRALVLICSHILLRSCLAQIPLALCSAFSSDHYVH